MADDKKKKNTTDDLEVSEDEMVNDEVLKLQEKCSEFETKYKRALADYQNLERQTMESQMRFAKLATQGFVEELVEPYDHLLLASKHLKDKGLEMVIAQFKHVFESQGLKEVNALNQSFDATKMEAIDTKEGEEGKVVEVISNGYELNGVVIKHARVVVGTKSN